MWIHIETSKKIKEYTFLFSLDHSVAFIPSKYWTFLRKKNQVKILIVTQVQTSLGV
jgi:hypothetical protein